MDDKLDEFDYAVGFLKENLRFLQVSLARKEIKYHDSLDANNSIMPLTAEQIVNLQERKVLMNQLITASDLLKTGQEIYNEETQREKQDGDS